MVVSLPAWATGAGKTVTVTFAVTVQDPEFAVTVYVVVVRGAATGEGTAGLLRPFTGVHVKLLPFEITESWAVEPSQIVSGAPVLRVRVLFTGTVMLPVFRQPIASLTPAV